MFSVVVLTAFLAGITVST